MESACSSPLKRPSAGRPQLSFEAKSSRSKDREAVLLANENSTEKLLKALNKSAKRKRKSLIPILNKVSEAGSASKLSKLITNSEKSSPTMLEPETALALISSCGLSQDNYQTIRNVALAHNADIFPSYHKVLSAKKECYPDGIQITETTAQQTLQNLLDHTAKRLLKLDEVKEKICANIEPNQENDNLIIDLRLSGKWGFDGATGQSQYKQLFKDQFANDKSLFSMMLVPLDLTDGKISFWRNSVPSSTRFCRPIKKKHLN